MVSLRAGFSPRFFFACGLPTPGPAPPKISILSSMPQLKVKPLDLKCGLALVEKEKPAEMAGIVWLCYFLIVPINLDSRFLAAQPLTDELPFSLCHSIRAQ